MSAQWGSQPFDAQVRFFAGKDLVPTARWNDLWKEAHDTGFMVAGAMKADLLADLHAAVAKAINDGTTLETFRKHFDQIVAKHGWTGWRGEGTEAGRAWRTRLIYDTNLNASYQAGRWAQIQAGKATRPYLEYRHSDLSVHPRPLHKSWNGKVIPVDDPWWRTHWPPNGWGCKCRAFALNERDLRRLGKTKPDAAPDDGTYEWVDRTTGETHTVPSGIDPGWDYVPGSLRGDLLQQIERKAATLPRPIGEALAAEVRQMAPVPPTPTFGTDLPENVEAKTLAEARKMSRLLISRPNAFDYFRTELADGRREPKPRFKHGRNVGLDVINRVFGKASINKLSLDALNAVNAALLQVQRECDRLKLPRLQGLNTAVARGAGATMGDGVLSVSVTSMEQYVSQDPAFLSRARSVRPVSTWTIGQPATERAPNATSHFEWGIDRLRNLVWHEFGHHIHQQYRVSTLADLFSPPLEKKLAELRANRDLVHPTKYSDANMKELFAESYSLYKMGREELIDSRILELIRKVEAGEEI